MDFNSLCEMVCALGADNAAVIKESDIVTNIAFFDICKSNGCGLFNRCYMCPPACGDPEKLMARVHTYSYGLLFQTIGELEDSFDFEGMTEAGKRHDALSLKVFEKVKELLPEDHWCLTKGGCSLCEKCAILTNEPCRHPDLATIGMEGACIDVSQTCKSTDMKYINGANTVTYFGLVLF